MIGLDKYINYFGGRFFTESGLGSGLAVLSKLLFCVYVIYRTQSILKYNEKYWCIILLIFFYSVTLVLSSQILIFKRIADTFSISLPLAAYILVRVRDSKLFTQINKAAVISLMLVLLGVFIKESLPPTQGAFNPERNPYKSVFSRP